MKDLSKTESKKDCFANYNDVDLLINLKWWFHDYCLPLNCFLQDLAMCLFWTATSIYHIVARSKKNKVETNCRRQMQELYLTDIKDQFVLWFLIVDKSVEWNVLSEAAWLTSSYSVQRHLCAFTPFENSSSWCWTSKKNPKTYRYNKNTTYGK